ncbi:hypothetical protein [Rodentibacter myodis]|uniref:Uncharacterized protein n=1 Tax=Rodentibacter myodis TaxID=1907939 RepID=A0A1V3JST1_9PAST|nr:hypothetical protein [Rodentibacter myodis]OOF59772.1 hypothetical protein BKL49_03015 [Rodentibacter myodis]
MTKIKSTIKQVLSNGDLIINKVDKNQTRDFLCKQTSYKGRLNDKDIKFLVEGALVKFTSNITEKGTFANDVELADQRLESSIKKILDNGDLIINKLDSNQKKDFLCKKSSYKDLLSKDEIESLKEEDIVSFIPNFVDDNRCFANELKLIRNSKIERISSKIQIDTKELTDIFLDKLKLNLEKIHRGHEFEDFTFFILKSLGIPEIYAVPKDMASGRADGIFKVSSVSTNGHRLEVIYDCTLKSTSTWEKEKITQISNYESQIIKNSININYSFGSTYSGKIVKQTISFSENADKQIWIITKGETRLIEDKQSPDILIKEISIYDLIEIMKERYLDSAFVKVDEIADTLKNLGSKLTK